VGFSSIKSYVESQVDLGKVQTSSFRRTLPQATQAGTWCDLSMATGNPSPNYYASAPLVSAVLEAKDGIFHGSNTAPDAKNLASLLVQSSSSTGVPVTLILCDYLLYYPFIDMDSTDQQDLTNTTPLPRYESGAGVRAFLVAQGNYVGGADFFITYTNQDGVTGRVSPTINSNTATFTATLVSSSDTSSIDKRIGPFIPLQSGDSGIRSVQSITFLSSNGGIAALVLAKTLGQHIIREQASPNEKNFIKDIMSAPRVRDGAFLNFLALPSGSLQSVAITGLADFVWG
jgi:hypothetical protein